MFVYPYIKTNVFIVLLATCFGTRSVYIDKNSLNEGRNAIMSFDLWMFAAIIYNRLYPIEHFIEILHFVFLFSKVSKYYITSKIGNVYKEVEQILYLIIFVYLDDGTMVMHTSICLNLFYIIAEIIQININKQINKQTKKWNYMNIFIIVETGIIVLECVVKNLN